MKRIILVGKAASGKDHARKLIMNNGGKYAVSYTTRPPREGEENGKDYFFISAEEFEWMINKDKFYEYVEFNGWYYGTTNKQMSDDDTFIMTPLGLSHLSKEDRSESFVVYFDIPEDIRKERMLARQGDADSVDRRLAADEADFKTYNDYDIIVTDPNYADEYILGIFQSRIQNHSFFRNLRSGVRTIMEQMNINKK